MLRRRRARALIGTDVVIEMGLVPAPVVEGARAGEVNALREVHRAYHPCLVRYLRGMGVADADGTARVVWFELARSMHRFTGDAVQLRRWLCTLARRAVFDAPRSRRAVFDAPRSRRAVFDAPRSRRRATSAAGSDRLDRTFAVIRELPPAQAEVLLLQVLLDLPASEVAHVTGQSPGTVRTMTDHAMARLAELLDPETGPAGDPVAETLASLREPGPDHGGAEEVVAEMAGWIRPPHASRPGRRPLRT